jgi:heme-degrading monooxygenase HmoA
VIFALAAYGGFVSSFATTPEPPYYAVIFASVRTSEDNGYAQAAKEVFELALKQPGFLGLKSARQEIGISVSYWASIESIRAWKDVER